MFRRLKISTKITGLVLIMVVMTLIAISYISFTLSKQAIRERYDESLIVLTNHNADRLDRYFGQIKANLEFVIKTKTIKDGVKSQPQTQAGSLDFFSAPTDDPFAMGDNSFVTEDQGSSGEDPGFDTAPAEPEVSYDVNGFLSDIKAAQGYADILITEPNGKITHSTNSAIKSGDNFTDPTGQTITEVKKGLHFSQIVKVEDKYFMYAGLPISKDDTQSPLFLVRIDVAQIYDMVDDTVGLGATGEVILSKLDPSNKKVSFLNPLRNRESSTLFWKDLGETEVSLAAKSVMEEPGSGMGTDYRNQQVQAAWSQIPTVNWGILTKIDDYEISSEINTLSMQYLIAGAMLLVLAVLGSLLFSRHVTNPLNSLKTTLELVGNGVLPENVTQKSKDEIGLMAQSVNYLVQTLKKPLVLHSRSAKVTSTPILNLSVMTMHWGMRL